MYPVFFLYIPEPSLKSPFQGAVGYRYVPVPEYATCCFDSKKVITIHMIMTWKR